MTHLLIAVIIGGGAGLFAYSKLGRRVGYGNSTQVWQITGLAFGAAFIMTLIVTLLLFPS